MEAFGFYLFAGIAVVSALGIVMTRNIVRAAVWLLGTLGSVACLYFLLDANFLAVVQLIVYAGGTLILIVFGVMLTSQSPWVAFTPTRRQAVLAILVAVLLFVGMAGLLVGAQWPAAEGRLETSPRVEEVGDALLTHYLVPFEVASVLLLVVMIGAAYLARPEE